MQPEEDIWGHDSSGTDEGCSLDGGADTSNRPWETDSLRIRAADRPTALGLLVIAAAATLALADMVLLYSPDGDYGFGGYAPLAHVPRWRLLLGHYLGVLLLPAYIPGYWLVFEGLREAGFWRSRPVLVLGSYAAAIGCAAHGLFALLALIVQHRDVDAAAAARLLELARAFVDPLHGLMSGLLVLLSICFAAAVLTGRTRFPRWLAAANPLVLCLAFLLPNLAAPGFRPALAAGPASFHLGHLVFFCLVTAALRGSLPGRTA